MTPTDLRLRARKYVSTARSLVEADPDVASNLVGQAAELALKARYCRRKGWLDFPPDVAGIKARGGKEIITHELDELLRLSDSVRIARSTLLDWDRICDWSVHQRYDPIGTTSVQDATAKIDATAGLLEALDVHEVVESLMPYSKDLQRSFGPFNLVAWVQGPHPHSAMESCPPGWYIVIAAWGLLELEYSVVDARLRALLDQHLAPDLQERMNGLLRLHPLEELAGDLAQFVQVENAEFCFLTSCSNDERLLPTAFIIKSRFFASAAAAGQ
jgi:hypothetical protein